MIHAAMLAAVISAWAGGADPALAPVSTRVVATDADAAAMLRAGYERSATFRALVATVESSRWRVFIQAAPCPVPETVGCLLHSIGHVNGEPCLYIRITRRGRRRDLAIATLAHEPQHASEVLHAPDVADPQGIRELFARIGYENVVSGGGIAFETDDAQEAGERVRLELADDHAVAAGDIIR